MGTVCGKIQKYECFSSEDVKEFNSPDVLLVCSLDNVGLFPALT